jgi:hypothetical protein
MRQTSLGIGMWVVMLACASAQEQSPTLVPPAAPPPIVNVNVPPDTVNWTDIGTLVVTVVGVIAALLSLEALRGQVAANIDAARAAREAALAATQQAKLTDQQMQASLRAYVRIFTNNPAFATDGIDVSLVLINVGKTPARLQKLQYHFVRSTTRLQELHSPEGYYERMNLLEEHGVTLFPGREYDPKCVEPWWR